MIYFTNAQREFAETGIVGIRFASIWGENGSGSDFIGFEAGARFPLHDHEGPEEILMISGRIRFGDLELSAGDYLMIGPGEQHNAVALEDTLFFLAHVGGAVIKE
jgi:quercetin dioxygenase-like cupin family protein